MKVLEAAGTKFRELRSKIVSTDEVSLSGLYLCLGFLAFSVGIFFVSVLLRSEGAARTVKIGQGGGCNGTVEVLCGGSPCSAEGGWHLPVLVLERMHSEWMDNLLEVQPFQTAGGTANPSLIAAAWCGLLIAFYIAQSVWYSWMGSSIHTMESGFIVSRAFLASSLRIIFCEIPGQLLLILMCGFIETRSMTLWILWHLVDHSALFVLVFNYETLIDCFLVNSERISKVTVKKTVVRRTVQSLWMGIKICQASAVLRSCMLILRLFNWGISGCNPPGIVPAVAVVVAAVGKALVFSGFGEAYLNLVTPREKTNRIPVFLFVLGFYDSIDAVISATFLCLVSGVIYSASY